MKLLALTSLFSLAQAWYGEQGYLATQPVVTIIRTQTVTPYPTALPNVVVVTQPVTVTQYQTNRRAKTISPILVTKMVTLTRTASPAVETGKRTKKKPQPQQMAVVNRQNEYEEQDAFDDDGDDNDDDDDDDDEEEEEAQKLGRFLNFAAQPARVPTTIYTSATDTADHWPTYETTKKRNTRVRQQAVVPTQKSTKPTKTAASITPRATAKSKTKSTTKATPTPTSQAATSKSSSSSASSQYGTSGSYYEWSG